MFVQKLQLPALVLVLPAFACTPDPAPATLDAAPVTAMAPRDAAVDAAPAWSRPPSPTVLEDCLAHEGPRCSGTAIRRCEDAPTTAGPVDCFARWTHRRPAWIPEHLGGDASDAGTDAGAALEWDRGSAFVGPVKLTPIVVQLEALPLVVMDAEGATHLLRGVVLYGRVDPSNPGSVDFEHPQDVAHTLEKCTNESKLPNAPTVDVWRAAICARLLGAPVAAIAKDWAGRCAEHPPPSDYQVDGAAALAASCFVDATADAPPRRKARGMATLLQKTLEAVQPLPPG